MLDWRRYWMSKTFYYLWYLRVPLVANLLLVGEGDTFLNDLLVITCIPGNYSYKNEQLNSQDPFICSLFGMFLEILIIVFIT